MLSQIRQQLAQNWKDDLHHSVSSVAASPLNRQLSYQTEYNTNLLSQLEGLEKENQQLRSRLAAADAVQGEWREGSREAEQRVEDLHRKLTISSQLCDRLSQQCSELRDTNGRLEMQSEDSSQELVALREKHRDALEHSARLDIRVQELEHRLGFSEAGRLWEGGEERARAGALDLSLQRCTQELADAHARAAGLERELSALSEENMDLRRQADRAHQATERETEARQSLQGNLAAVTSELHQLKIHSRQLELDRKESIESNEVRRLEMSYADRAQHLAAEMSHRADEKWRQLEDIVRSRDRELSVCAEDTARLQRLVAGADRRLRLAEERWQERERLILADLAFHEEQAVAKEAAHSAELASYRSAVSDQQKRCEVLSDSLIEQQTDMAAQTAALRDQFDAGISELAAARNEAHAEAQSLRRELGEQAGLNRQEALKLRAEVDAQARRAQQLKEALVSRGEKFVVTLELLQAAVRQCVQETSEWKLKNSYLSSQMNKLLVVLGSLSAPPAARSPLFPDMTPVPGSANGPVRVNFDYTNLAEETILDSVPIALRPIRIYGDEIRRSFVMFAQRVASNSAIIGDLQGELRKTKLSLDECMFSLDEERSDLFATKKLISGAKAQTMNVERDLENKERAHRDQVHMIEAVRDAALVRAEKAEERALELTRQLTVLQADLAKTGAELKAVRATYSIETNKLEEKMSQSESVTDTFKKEYQELRRKYDEIVAENRKESEQRIRIRDELKRCRDIAHDTATSFVSEKEKLQEQVASMGKMLGHYEVQLKQKESLLEVIKSQRTELSDELKKLRAESLSSSDSTQRFSSRATPGRTHWSNDGSRTPTSTLNAVMPTTAQGYIFHPPQDLAARDTLSGYSNQLKHLTQSIKQIERHDATLNVDSTFNATTDLSGHHSFRMPAMDPEVSIGGTSFTFTGEKYGSFSQDRFIFDNKHD